jgi:hypothetical protein
MKVFTVIVLMIALLFSGSLQAGMMPDPETMKALDAKVDNLMTAYNSGDDKAFYADWAASMAALCTPQVFKMMFVDGHMANYGAYKSRKIIEAETVVVPDVPNGLLVYAAEFEKNAKIKLSINLIKEGDDWKFQQVTIMPMP